MDFGMEWNGLDFGMDFGLDFGMDFGLDFGLSIFITVFFIEIFVFSFSRSLGLSRDKNIDRFGKTTVTSLIKCLISISTSSH